MSGLRTDQVPLFLDALVDGDSEHILVGNVEKMTLISKGSGIGDPVLVELFTTDTEGNEFLLNSYSLTATKPFALPAIFSGAYTKVFVRLSGISAGTYTVFLNLRRNV